MKPLQGQHAMTGESDRKSCEPAAVWPALTFNDAADVPWMAASAVRARLHACLQSCPDVRARAVTEPSPMAVFRHTDIHAPPPRDRLESSAIRFLNATSTIEGSQS